MLEWLKKVLHIGGQEEFSPGGSRMYRYEGDEFSRSQLGLPEEDTSGMSDMRMTLPKEIDSEYSRVELIFYCDDPKEDYLELLRMMAHFPHDNKTWLGHGHTMPNGNPPQPLFEHTPVFSGNRTSYV